MFRRRKLTVASVKALGYDIVVARQMSPAVAAGVHLRAVEVHHGVVLRQGPPRQGAMLSVPSLLLGGGGGRRLLLLRVASGGGGGRVVGLLPRMMMRCHIMRSVRAERSGKCRGARGPRLCPPGRLLVDDVWRSSGRGSVHGLLSYGTKRDDLDG
jgi:hypothetical protein